MQTLPRLQWPLDLKWSSAPRVIALSHTWHWWSHRLVRWLNSSSNSFADLSSQGTHTWANTSAKEIWEVFLQLHIAAWLRSCEVRMSLFFLWPMSPTSHLEIHTSNHPLSTCLRQLSINCSAELQPQWNKMLEIDTRPGHQKCMEGKAYMKGRFLQHLDIFHFQLLSYVWNKQV